MQNLPTQLTQFIGRRRELKEVTELLADPACRLLTIVGPGGIGKTRLALQTASETQDDYNNGIVFIPLQAVRHREYMLSAVADALNFSLAAEDDLLLQLGRFLAEKSLLLIWDNFEQLLAEAEILTQLLQMAPHLKCLVTSRERLNLQGEWVFVLPGLVIPASSETEAWETTDAVTLFAERARQIRRDFSLEAEAEAVITICRLTEGMPLALEMAAAWLKTLSAVEVATEIRQNLDFLTTASRDVPERHRSVRALFAYSWQRLNPDEQLAFARLSVFQGGCRRDAAVAIAAATLPILSELVDKSLLRMDEDGRYQIHELLRQFAAEKLAQSPAEQQQARQAHAAYYTRFLGDRFAEMTGGDQPRVVREVATELDNIRAAWRYAVYQQDSAALAYAVTTLHTYYQYQGRFREGVEALKAAVNAIQQSAPSPQRDRDLAIVLTCAAWLEIRFGRITESVEMAESAVSLYENLDELPPPGAGTDPLTTLSLLAVMRGGYQESKDLGQQAWQRAEARTDYQNMAYAGYSLTSAALAEGDRSNALQLAQKTLNVAQKAGNRWFMTYIHYQLGEIMQARGELAAAKACFQAGYYIRADFNDPDGMAMALGLLAEIAIKEKSYDEARQIYHQTANIYQETGNEGALVQSWQKLGVAAYKQGQLEKAHHYLWLALEKVHSTQLEQLTLAVLADLGLVLLADNETAWGLAVLDFVQGHPLTTPPVKKQAAQASSGYAEDVRPFPLPPESDLNTLLLLLEANLSPPQTVKAELPAFILPAEQPLIEPLTEREQEILALIVAGLKNKEIASELTVSLSTVKTHINNIYGKLGVSSRVQAVTRAQELDLIAS